jgi:hypothetical protein
VKRWKIICVLGLIIGLLTVCVIVLSLPRVSMRIKAVGPTGHSFYKYPQPIWSFSLTNTGSYDVKWICLVDIRGNWPEEYRDAIGFVRWPEGTLAPGQGLETNMIVPAEAGSVWRPTVYYWPVRTRGDKSWEYSGKWHEMPNLALHLNGGPVAPLGNSGVTGGRHR